MPETRLRRAFALLGGAFVVYLAVPFAASAQQSDVPAASESLAQGLPPLSEVALLAVPGVGAFEAQANVESRGEPLRFASPYEVSVAASASGSWVRASGDGASVWRLRVSAPGSVSLNLGFDRYRMPPGGRLFLYTPDRQTVLGPFTEADNESHGQLWTPILPGDELVIEVQVPARRERELQLGLGSVNRGFRDLPPKPEGDQGECNVDVVCSAGDDWRSQIRSVGFLTISGRTTCSGVLVNNTASDLKPYLLTANHCSADSRSAASVVVYWNYESESCGDRSGGSKADFQSGAYLRATHSESDVTLLELDDPAVSASSLHWAGWDASTANPTSGVGIHHPSGGEKSISVDDDAMMTTNLGWSYPDPDGSYVRVGDWDQGTTEGGSSGSPLFDQDGFVVGLLSSGWAACGNDKSDWYGRLSSAWAGGGTSGSRLSDWLDPDDSDASSLAGRDNSLVAAVGSIADQSLEEGSGAVTLPVATAFNDPDGDAVSYRASSSAPAVASAAMSGSQLTLTPVAAGSATVTVLANDAASADSPASQTIAVTVTPPRGVSPSVTSLFVAEGSNGKYTVVLDAAPTGSVTVSPSPPAGTDVSTAPASLTFTTTNWSTAQEVTVSAAEDQDAQADAAVTIGHQVSGADYGSVTAPSVKATIVENDAASLWVESAEVSEGGGAIGFAVGLSLAAASDVTVDYATSDGSGDDGARSGADYTAASGTLTFAAGSAGTKEVQVQVTDDEEDEADEEVFAFTLGSATNASLAGGGSTLAVEGTILDDDVPKRPARGVSASEDELTVPEGSSETYTLVLDAAPTGSVTVSPSPPSGTDVSTAPASLTFEPANWSRPQTVLVSAAEDEDAQADPVATISHRVSGADYGSVTGPSVQVTIVENDESQQGGGTGGTGGTGGGAGDQTDGDGDGDGSGDTGTGPSGPPRAAIALNAECSDDLCRARTGVPVRFEDASTGVVRFRNWEFGDGRRSRRRELDHAWTTPGFFVVTLTVGDGERESAASRVFLVEASEPAGTCEADAATLCLQDSRFAVRVSWFTAEGETGAGRVLRLGTNDSGVFWFFDPDNWEVLIKVLDGCALNDRIWVYGASSTDLGYTIEVKDTATGDVREYGNEPGRPAAAVTDAAAFPAACASPD